MNVTARLFARARDVVGSETVTVKLSAGATVADLRLQLVADYPALENLSSHLLMAVGTEYVTDEAALADGADIAVFPPVSGG